MANLTTAIPITRTAVIGEVITLPNIGSAVLTIEGNALFVTVALPAGMLNIEVDYEPAEGNDEVIVQLVPPNAMPMSVQGRGRFSATNTNGTWTLDDAPPEPPTIDLSFLPAAGPTIGYFYENNSFGKTASTTLATYLTLANPSPGTVVDSTGLVVDAVASTATAFQPRIAYSPGVNPTLLGQLLEPASTNLVPNSLAPTFVSPPTGTLTTSTDVPPPYNGSAGTATVYKMVYQSGNQVAAQLTGITSTMIAPGCITMSLWIYVPSAGSHFVTTHGSTPVNISASGTGVTTINKQRADPNRCDGWQIVSTTIQQIYPSAAITWNINMPGAATGDVMYFALPQIEELEVPTSYIPTTGVIATRAADVLSFPTAMVFNPLQGWSLGVEAVTPVVYPGKLNGSAVYVSDAAYATTSVNISDYGNPEIPCVTASVYSNPNDGVLPIDVLAEVYGAPIASGVPWKGVISAGGQDMTLQDNSGPPRSLGVTEPPNLTALGIVIGSPIILRRITLTITRLSATGLALMARSKASCGVTIGASTSTKVGTYLTGVSFEEVVANRNNTAGQPMLGDEAGLISLISLLNKSQADVHFRIGGGNANGIVVWPAAGITSTVNFGKAIGSATAANPMHWSLSLFKPLSTLVTEANNVISAAGGVANVLFGPGNETDGVTPYLLVSAGSGYPSNMSGILLTLSGGSGASPATVLSCTSNTAGAITAINSVSVAGVYTTYLNPNAAAATTAVTGSGATVTVAWRPQDLIPAMNAQISGLIWMGPDLAGPSGPFMPAFVTATAGMLKQLTFHNYGNGSSRAGSPGEITVGWSQATQDWAFPRMKAFAALSGSGVTARLNECGSFNGTGNNVAITVSGAVMLLRMLVAVINAGIDGINVHGSDTTSFSLAFGDGLGTYSPYGVNPPGTFRSAGYWYAQADFYAMWLVGPLKGGTVLALSNVTLPAAVLAVAVACTDSVTRILLVNLDATSTASVTVSASSLTSLGCLVLTAPHYLSTNITVNGLTIPANGTGGFAPPLIPIAATSNTVKLRIPPASAVLGAVS